MALDNPVLPNYLLPLPDPTAGIRNDLELAVGLQQSQRQGQAAEQDAQLKALQIQSAQQQMNAQQLAQQRQLQLRQDFQGLTQSRNPNAVADLLVKYPEFREQIQGTSEALSNEEIKQLAPIYAAMVKNSPAIVAQETNKLISAYDNSKLTQKADPLRLMLQSYQVDPGGTTATLAAKIATDMGPAKFAETFGKLVEQPADLLKKESDARAAKVTADYAEPKAQTDIASTRATTKSALATAEKTAQETADLKKLSAGKLVEQGLSIDKLKQDLGTLPEAVGKQVGERIDAAEKSQSTANTAGNLAPEFDKIDGFFKSGQRAKALGALNTFWGSEGSRAALRQEYQQLINRATLEELRGVRMTENEIHLIQSGFPAADANPKLVGDFLRGLQKLAQGKADTETAKAQWLSGNRNLGPATKELTILGQKVKSGTDFTEFTAARQAKAAEASAKQAASAAPASPPTSAPAPGSPAALDPAKAARAAAIKARLAQINQGGGA